MFDLHGKVALVTGGSRGIGRAISIQLAKLGADIAINYKENETAARECADQIESLGRQPVLARGDVAVPEDVERVMEIANQAFGRIDILVNNAGFHRDALILRMTLEDWDAVLNANLKGAFLCTKAVLRYMMRQRWGRIINIGSISGLAGNAGQVNYAAAKAGLIGLTKSVAREMGSRGITANVIAPSLVMTELTKNLDQRLVAEAIRRSAVGRLGTPEDIAAIVVFLASEEASFITGQVISVDGGLEI